MQPLKFKISELDATEKGIGADMSLYFLDTLAKVSLDGQNAPKWLRYRGQDGTNHLFAGDKEKFYVPLLKAGGAYILSEFPTGFFNTKKSSVWCTRIPKRQYLKGLSPHNFSMLSAESLCYTMKMMHLDHAHPYNQYLPVLVAQTPVAFVPSFFEWLFSEKYTELSEAVHQIRAAKAFSRAVSKNFALVPSPNSTELIVLYDGDNPVGEYQAKTKTIKTLMPEFKQEMQDFFSAEYGVNVK